jgi:prepilin-type processing-associated H-X9-DG protein
MRDCKELLVLMLFTAGLFLTGATTMSRKLAQQALCADHLRKIYKFNVSYQNDYGVLPPVWVPTKPLWTFWISYLRPYSSSDKVFCCPSDPRVQLIFDDKDPLFSFKRTKVSSYAMNERLNSWKKNGRISLTMLKYPNRFIFFGDGICGVLRLPSLPGIPRHSDKVQYVFGDGHTSLKALSQLRHKSANGKWIYKDINWKPW